MAGEWLKIEHHLAEKPEVLQIAATCEIEPDLVVGRLIKVWSWASRNCLSGGKTHIAALQHLNTIGGHERFAESMIEAGWLKVKDTEMTFVNFDRHISQSAKERALNSAHKAKQRSPDYVPKMSRFDLDKKKTREEKNKGVQSTPIKIPSCL
jgi:DNA replication protein DnaT